MNMIKANKHIEIVSSTKSGFSSMSQVSRDAALAVLAKRYTDVRVTLIDNLSDLEALVARQPDLIFLGMKFIPVNPALGLSDSGKIWIAEYLDEHGIAYTGSGHMAHELELNKPLAKQRALDAGLNTSLFYVARQNQSLNEADIPLPYPVFIKPTSRGGGLGIDSDSVAYNFEQLRSKVNSIATKLQSDSLIEKYLSGREFSVAILKSEHLDEFSVMPIELIAPPDEHGVRILSGKVKSSDTESFVEVTDKIIKAKVSALAINIFQTLGGRDYGRIDIRLDAAGTPHFLEANLIPSLINCYGNFPKACLLNMGMGYESMILSIVGLGLTRNLKVDEGALEPITASHTILPSFETSLEPAAA